MNDKDRDRSGDGAGPVAPNGKHTCPSLVRSILMLTVLLFYVPLSAHNSNLEIRPLGHVQNPGLKNYNISTYPYSIIQDSPRLRGLSLTIQAGVLKAFGNQADFYNGNPTNVNTLERILYSESFGNTIWNNLTEQNLIGSSVANYRQITVAEYGHMYYKLAFQFGIGFRYDFEQSLWAWHTRFNYAKLNAVGTVLLNSGHNTAFLTNQNAYVVCPTSGLEERIFIDLGIIRKFRLNSGFDLETSLGVNLNNTKVESSDIRIAGVTYSILDIWQGQSPSSYTGTYNYVNQGGIGYGLYASLSLGITLPALTAMSLAYTFSYSKINLKGYENFSPHHALALNVAINNFSFFDD